MLQNVKRPINVVIIPGSRHTKKEYWYPQLANSLREEGLEVLYPHFPLLPFQTLTNWETTLRHHEGRFTDKTIFVGHSLGGRFLFKYLEKRRAGAAIFVSAPYQAEIENWRRQLSGSLGGRILIALWQQTNGTFFEEPVNWKAIKQNVNKIHLFYSTYDLFIPKTHLIEIQKMLAGEIHWIENGRHLDVDLERIPELTATVLKIYREITSSHPEGQSRGVEH